MAASLDILSVGMVSAVGLDAPSSCAALRAGIDGFQETRFALPNGDRLIGAPVQLPKDIVGETRLAYMVSGAIVEAFNNFPDARGQTALMMCLPEEDRPGRPIRDTSRFLKRVAEFTRVEPTARSRLVAHGRPAGHVALDRARRMIKAGEAKYVLIAGVDTYLTAASVAYYLDQRRILTLDNSNGFIPGEAAAAILCGSAERQPLRLYGLGLAREPGFIYNPKDIPLRGDGMTSAYKAALEETGTGLNRVGYVISDLIGESYWFKQTALTSTRLYRGQGSFQDLWSPAESLGNIGAAAVPLMIGMAWTAAKKGYAGGQSVLIESSNDAGACGAGLFVSKAA